MPYGRGMRFGFRGSSPPWPFVGRGRGGLPRCGYYLGSTVGRFPLRWAYQQPTHAFDARMPFAPQMTREQELDFLKDQAEAIKEQLEQIQAQMHDLEDEEKKTAE